MNCKTIIISKKKRKRKKSPRKNLCLLAPDIVLNKLYLNMEFEGSCQAKKNIQHIQYNHRKMIHLLNNRIILVWIICFRLTQTLQIQLLIMTSQHQRLKKWIKL